MSSFLILLSFLLLLSSLLLSSFQLLPSRLVSVSSTLYAYSRFLPSRTSHNTGSKGGPALDVGFVFLWQFCSVCMLTKDCIASAFISTLAIQRTTYHVISILRLNLALFGHRYHLTQTSSILNSFAKLNKLFDSFSSLLLYQTY